VEEEESCPQLSAVVRSCPHLECGVDLLVVLKAGLYGRSGDSLPDWVPVRCYVGACLKGSVKTNVLRQLGLSII